MKDVISVIQPAPFIFFCLPDMEDICCTLYQVRGKMPFDSDIILHMK